MFREKKLCDDSPRLESGGFYGQAESLSSQATNVFRSIEVSIKVNMTAWTSEDTDIQGHLLSMSTGATRLTRIGRVHLHKLPASFFRFARQFAKKLRPRGIGNAVGQAMIMGHMVDVQVFHADDSKAINNLAAFLMREVVTSELNPLVYTSDNLAMLPTLRRTLSKFAVLALHTGKGFLFLAKEAGIGYFFSIAESSERLQANINTDLSSNRFKSFRLTLATQRDVPLAGRGALHGTGFDFALDGAVIDHLDTPNLGKCHTVIVGDGKARLGEGEGVVAVTSTKTVE